ncbi:unnamed protein product, partial [marine sediment metagenome]
YGPDLERAGWHSAGIEVINPMPVPLYDVYAIAGFSDESNPDGSSVEVRDTTNGGVILERGPNYDVTDTSIHFNIQTGMAAYETRAFTVGYYKMQQESYIYDEGIVSVPFFEITTWDGGSYNFFPAHWTNPYDRTFRGALYIKLNFDIPTEIDAMSMRIYDLTHDHEIDPSLFIPVIFPIHVRLQSANSKSSPESVVLKRVHTIKSCPTVCFMSRFVAFIPMPPE